MRDRGAAQASNIQLAYVDAIFLDEPVQATAADPQRLGRTRFVSAFAREDLQDVGTLNGGQIFARLVDFIEKSERGITRG